jgi:hypothetical protein
MLVNNVFVQVGATRDGLDPYLDSAHYRGMQAILVETPDYIRWRKMFSRREFDQTIAVEHPANPDEVLHVLKEIEVHPSLILAGFERYAKSAYLTAHKLCTLPHRDGYNFVPPNKLEQRILLTRRSPSVLQPNYFSVTDAHPSPTQLERLNYPLVVKPVDGGGGLGVFLVSDSDELRSALAELQMLTNYDGGAFEGIIIEEYISGNEYSVQGIARNGEAHILTLCEKFISIEPSKTQLLIKEFRESGHIALKGDQVSTSIKQFVQSCIDAFEYRDGPFHIDMVESVQGIYYLEIGFRLSGGGLVNLVRRASGFNWADESFSWHLSVPSIQPVATSNTYIGQIVAMSDHEITIAYQLQAQGHAIEIQIFSPPPNSSTAIKTQRLESDLARHTGMLGRIIVTSPTLADVQHLLQICSPRRTKQSGLLSLSI